MGLDSKLKEALREFKKEHTQIFTATVTAVDQNAKTITCKDAEGFEFKEVRLAAAEDDKKSVLIIPVIGSSVLIGIIGNALENLFVAKVNEVDKVVGSIENTSFEINASGYQVDRSGENLKAVLNDLIDEINKIKVIYGNTVNVVAVEAVRDRLNTILI